MIFRFNLKYRQGIRYLNKLNNSNTLFHQTQCDKFLISYLLRKMNSKLFLKIVHNYIQNRIEYTSDLKKNWQGHTHTKFVAISSAP